MLTLSVLEGEFAVCRLEGEAPIPGWATGHSFFSVTRTPEELSIVCPAASVPPGLRAERGWRCLKVHGPLDFGQTGILHALAEPLAGAGISIFALSTYDTDYLLVKAGDLPAAMAALRGAGHRIAEGR
ncbi:MAG: ACT domain-containing protein [Caldilineae bacterium]|nr:MAG: ACT domain-containing protein [Caldilineae bacterium]